MCPANCNGSMNCSGCRREEYSDTWHAGSARCQADVVVANGLCPQSHRPAILEPLHPAPSTWAQNITTNLYEAMSCMISGRGELSSARRACERARHVYKAQWLLRCGSRNCPPIMIAIVMSLICTFWGFQPAVQRFRGTCWVCRWCSQLRQMLLANSCTCGKHGNPSPINQHLTAFRNIGVCSFALLPGEMSCERIMHWPRSLRHQVT